jgi:UDP-glucose 4-epimerase
LSKNKISGSVVTITGGTGSFGSTMLSHLLLEGAAEVRVFSRDEAKQDQLKHNIADNHVQFYIGETRDPLGIKHVLNGTDLNFYSVTQK